MIKNTLGLLLFLSFAVSLSAQGVLPVHRYHIQKSPLNVPDIDASFGYSLRKIKTNYTGFAVKVRNGTTNAEGNLNFDSSNIVSTGSNVIITAAGSSGFSIGDAVTFNTFKGAALLFVSIWYDQGDKNYNAVQTNTTRQPQLILNTAGAANTKPSISFDGIGDYLAINQPIQNIVTNGINGTFMLALKTSANKKHSFGYIASNN